MGSFRLTASRQTRTEAIASRFKQANAAALFAAATVIQNEVKRALRGGYKTSLANWAADVMAAELEAGRTKVPRKISVKVGRHWRPVGGGAFVTGNSVNHVAIGEVTTEAGRSGITVGTDLKYNLFWEIGHHNLFTRHYERDEKWSPAFKESSSLAKETYIRVLKEQLEEVPFETQDER